MAYESAGNYFISYARPKDAVTRTMVFRIIVLVCVAIAFACAMVTNAVSYLYMTRGHCWWPNTTPADESVYNYPSARCLVKGTQPNFWSIKMVPATGADLRQAQFACIPILMGVGLASVVLAGAWVGTSFMQCHDRGDADLERESGAEPQVFTHQGAGVRMVNKDPSMYRTDEVRRRVLDQKMSVANLSLAAVGSALAFISLICHAAHVARLASGGAKVHGFFACIFVTLIFFLVATVICAVPYFAGLTCCFNAEDGLPRIANAVDEDDDVHRPAHPQDAAKQPPSSDPKRNSDFSPIAAGGGEDDGERIVMPVYGYSMTRPGGDGDGGAGAAPASAESREETVGNSQDPTTQSGGKQVEYPSEAPPPGETAPPLYGHDRSAPTNE